MNAFIKAKNRSSVQNVTSHLKLTKDLRSTQDCTQGRDHISVQSVTSHTKNQGICRNIKIFIRQKNFFRVLNVICHLHGRVNYATTSWSTVERHLSSARNQIAERVSAPKAILTLISRKCTSLRKYQY